jgi:uncharacterized protein YukE
MVIVRLERLLASARWFGAQGDRARMLDCYRQSAANLNQIAAKLNDTDRAALRVHSWSMRIRQGLR